jgi:hypothetical protein
MGDNGEHEVVDPLADFLQEFEETPPIISAPPPSQEIPVAAAANDDEDDLDSFLDEFDTFTPTPEPVEEPVREPVAPPPVQAPPEPERPQYVSAAPVSQATPEADPFAMDDDPLGDFMTDADDNFDLEVAPEPVREAAPPVRRAEPEARYEPEPRREPEPPQRARPERPQNFEKPAAPPPQTPRQNPQQGNRQARPQQEERGRGDREARQGGAQAGGGDLIFDKNLPDNQIVGAADLETAGVRPFKYIPDASNLDKPENIKFKLFSNNNVFNSNFTENIGYSTRGRNFKIGLNIMFYN